MIEINSLHPFEVKILLNIEENKEYTISELAKNLKLKEAQIRSGINWLLSKNLIEKSKSDKKIKYVITDKGEIFAKKGLLEIEIKNLLEKNANLKIKDIMDSLDFENKDIGSTIGYLKKNNEIEQTKDGYLKIKKFNIDYYNLFKEFLELLKEKKELEEEEIDNKYKEVIKKASQIQLHKSFFKIKEFEIPYYKINKEGIKIKNELKKSNITGEEISQITPEILKDKKWEGKNFRKYNINLPSPHLLIGRKHPYREFLDFLKYKFVGLGFKEMRGSLVETEFWNMDALYMPQTHPARDIHDVYFIKEPKYAKEIKEPYFTNVAKTHTDGGETGSKGWGYNFDKEKAKQLILRSQGTVLSAKMLASNPEIPGKYFAIARCFRYDRVDATHLADFFQVEGIVISEKVNFKTLLGLLNMFAKEIAKAEDIKFVPAYFPFTEPSVELHIKHPELGWYELGGAGIFRPEVTEPLGIKTPVLAWGLGVDRMAMMALHFNDIRNLFSRDLDLIRDTRMVI